MTTQSAQPPPGAEDNHILLTEPAPHVCVVKLNRPPVNAMGRLIRERMIDIFAELEERDDIRAIILTGAGGIFSAGADIKEKKWLAAGRPGDVARANRLTRDSFFCLLDSSKPIIAAVNGAALGAGFVMAACCDFIIAAGSAYFAMPEIDVGQGGGASFLQRILPQQLMRKMLLTGERVRAHVLKDVGAILDVVPDDELLPAAIELAGKIAQKSPPAVRAIRESFTTVAELSLRDGFLLEQRYTTALSLSPEAEAARQAFFQKRKSKF